MIDFYNYNTELIPDDGLINDFDLERKLYENGLMDAILNFDAMRQVPDGSVGLGVF